MKNINKWDEVLEQRALLKHDFESINRNINKGIALFGAGQFGISSLNYLKKHGYNVRCFIDNSPNKKGLIIDSIPVVSLDSELAKSTELVLITAKHAILSIKNQLAGHMLNMSFDTWFVMDNFEKYTQIRNQYFCDERSKIVLDGILLTMLTGNENYCAEVMEFNQYFCLPQFVNTGNEYFLDAGAYVGDSIEKFIMANNGGFKHIYGFEPGRLQFEALNKRKERLIAEWALKEEALTLINAGLADVDSYAIVNSCDTMLLSTNLVVNNEETATATKVFKLDTFLKKNKLTFIKADIEGMEMAMLRGAENTIRFNKPKLALSVYHEPDDLINMIELIRLYVSDYKMALRHHSPMLMDTTLYCWRD